VGNILIPSGKFWLWYVKQQTPSSRLKNSSTFFGKLTRGYSLTTLLLKEICFALLILEAPQEHFVNCIAP
jgi:hypothetical protein